MVADIFVELSIIIILATAIASILRLLRQPLIVAYILTGILVSPRVLGIVSATDAVAAFSKIGVALLLFIVGINLNPRLLRELGRVAVITGLSQILFTALIGFAIAHYVFAIAALPALYLAVALTFSSTIIIMKLLSDKGDLESLYGRISIGFLIVQDIVAMALLVAIAVLTTSAAPVTSALLSGGAALAGLALFSLVALPRISAFISRSQEYLYLFTISWVLLWAATFQLLGLSIEAGALISGITLSTLPYRYEISAKVKPLRDFFLVLFFVFLGLQLQFGQVMMVPILAFSLFILVGNPLIVMAVMGLMGYTKKTSFFAGLTVAQISEFSLILLIIGQRVGHVPPEILPLVTVVGLITITVSTYFILYANPLYARLSPYLTIFERKGRKVDQHRYLTHRHYDAILFGHNRIGFDIAQALRAMKKKVLIVDFNPETIRKLKAQKIDCIYGDAEDVEFVHSLNLPRRQLVISTIPDVATNLLLLENSGPATLLCVAEQVEDMRTLYEKGVPYVIMPHLLGGRFAAHLIQTHGTNKQAYRREMDHQIERLRRTRRLGGTYQKSNEPKRKREG